jgi:hypothetical protein
MLNSIKPPSTFDPYMPIAVVGHRWVVLCSRFFLQGFIRSPASWPLLDPVCYVAVLAIALSTNVRINKQIACWSVQILPDDRMLLRATWVRCHIVRTLFSLLALACCILVSLLDDSPCTGFRQQVRRNLLQRIFRGQLWKAVLRG